MGGNIFDLLEAVSREPVMRQYRTSVVAAAEMEGAAEAALGMIGAGVHGKTYDYVRRTVTFHLSVFSTTPVSESSSLVFERTGTSATVTLKNVPA